jgi:hypothetical protein
MQTKSFGQIYKVLLNIRFILKKCLITVLKCIVEFYKNLETCLNAFGIQMIKLWKKSKT